MKISIIGLGYIGLPTAVILAKNGHKVYGYDTNPSVVGSLNRGRLHIKEEGLQDYFTEAFSAGAFSAHSELQTADVYIISVPTPFKDNSEKKLADLQYVLQAAESVSHILKEGDLVILESTVPPSTTKNMTDLLQSGSGLPRDSFYTAHCPERVLPGNILFELEHNDRIIGAEREQSAVKAKELYESFVKSGSVYLTDDITAEMCKLVENSFRDINIAFANELSVICSEIGIDVKELISLANKHPRVNILSPGVGVGGHCIAVDPWFLAERFGQSAALITAARNINDFKPYWVSEQIEQRINADKGTVIGVLGLAYKPDIDDFRESPSIKLAHILMQKGYSVISAEPNAAQEYIEQIPVLPLEEVLDKAGFVVMTLRHKEFLERSDDIKKTDCMIL